MNERKATSDDASAECQTNDELKEAVHALIDTGRPFIFLACGPDRFRALVYDVSLERASFLLEAAKRCVHREHESKGEEAA